MKLRHIVIDTVTGESLIRGTDGRDHAMSAVADLERRAADGDAEALALIATLEHEVVDMTELLHDCPECRAAMARGEVPTIGGGEELLARARTRRARPRPLRWRTRKGRPS